MFYDFSIFGDETSINEKKSVLESRTPCNMTIIT